MYHAVKVVLLGCALFFATSTSVQALKTTQLTLQDNPFREKYGGLLTEDPIIDSTEEDEKQPAPEGEATPDTEPTKTVEEHTTHVIVAGENLSIIAERYDTTWNRLFAKNESIVDPNVITVGTTITIPDADEPLPERPLPTPAPQAASPVPQNTQNRTATAAIGRAPQIYTTGASTAGNTYAAGYCTWYAKNRRPDLPNMLGNASSWAASAAARGYATGHAPRVGAIGQQGNHVVYVESVNADGTVSISEMNYGGGLYAVNHRTVPASSFIYIY